MHVAVEEPPRFLVEGGDIEQEDGGEILERVAIGFHEIGGANPLELAGPGSRGRGFGVQSTGHVVRVDAQVGDEQDLESGADLEGENPAVIELERVGRAAEPELSLVDLRALRAVGES